MSSKLIFLSFKPLKHQLIKGPTKQKKLICFFYISTFCLYQQFFPFTFKNAYDNIYKNLYNYYIIILYIIIYNYINLRSSIIYCLFSGGMYIFLGISSAFFVCIGVIDFLKAFCDIVLRILLSLYNLVTISAILLPIKSTVASAVF